jgi:transcriptional regulator with XRE-family HTH domain
MTYGEALRRILRDSHLSQADLARAIGKSNSYVSQLCSGKVREPSVSLAFAIADALGTDVQTFLDLMHSDAESPEE